MKSSATKSYAACQNITNTMLPVRWYAMPNISPNSEVKINVATEPK